MSAPIYRELLLDLVNDPPAPTRLIINELDLESLAASIQAHGLLQPIGVVENLDRFDVVFGHRRLLAHRMLQADTIRAFVYDSTSEAMLGAQLAENVDRANLSPVEEAIWFAQLWEALACGTDELALRLKVTIPYLEGRLNLLRGDPNVLQALRDGKIGIGVARRLNDYADAGDRIVLLDAAIAGGATERLVTSWIADRAKIAEMRGGQASMEPLPPPSLEAPPPADTLRCALCESDQDAYSLEPLWVHRPCRRILDGLIKRMIGGAHAETPVAGAKG